jgi:hypothetical protein
VVHSQTRIGPCLPFRIDVSPSSELPRSSSSPLIRAFHSRRASRHHLHVLYPSNISERPALSSESAFTMSAGDDIDDELFALAGGDEDADIEEGEA